MYYHSTPPPPPPRPPCLVDAIPHPFLPFVNRLRLGPGWLGSHAHPCTHTHISHTSTDYTPSFHITPLVWDFYLPSGYTLYVVGVVGLLLPELSINMREEDSGMCAILFLTILVYTMLFCHSSPYAIPHLAHCISTYIVLPPLLHGRCEPRGSVVFSALRRRPRLLRRTGSGPPPRVPSVLQDVYLFTITERAWFSTRRTTVGVSCRGYSVCCTDTRHLGLRYLLLGRAVAYPDTCTQRFPTPLGSARIFPCASPTLLPGRGELQRTTTPFATHWRLRRFAGGTRLPHFCDTRRFTR